MATSHTKQPAGRCCLVALAAVVGVAQGVAQQGLIAPHCNPACGEGGECVEPNVTPNVTSNGEGQCVCSDGFSGDACQTKSACDNALARECATERKQNYMACAICSGRHQTDLQKAGCKNADIDAFCRNQTCATQLADNCSRPAAVGASCAQCTACAKKQRLCAADTQQRDAFCKPGCLATRTCELTMESNCGADRREGMFECVKCSGRHADELHAKNCSNSLIQSYCNDKGCIARLADKCRAPAGNASCFDCARCAADNRNATQCTSTQDGDAFCSLFAKDEAPAISCDGALTQLCSSELKTGGFFGCVKCSGVYNDDVALANCSIDNITKFCHAQGGVQACPQKGLLAACGHTLGTGHGSCSGCASCVAAAVVARGCSTTELRQFCDSDCPTGNWSFDKARGPQCVCFNGTTCEPRASGVRTVCDGGTKSCQPLTGTSVV
jgi:hypothetical protein